jgi:hypothetical protein
MNYKYIPTSSIEEIQPIRNTPVEIDEWILEDFMYTPTIGVEGERLRVRTPNVVDKMIYELLEQTNGNTFI